jgi:hypothetical protein
MRVQNLALIAWGTLLYAAAGSVQAELLFDIVTNAKPTAAIIIGSEASRIDVHSAQELQQYVQKMSGVKIPILKENAPDVTQWNNRILIGRTESNGITKKLVQEGIVRLSSDYPGLDGFVIKHVQTNGITCLVLGGSMDRGTLYAAYDLLEKFCGVGFFQDGERIPQTQNISVKNANVAERPFFEDRGHNYWNAHWILPRYSSRFWKIDDFKKYFDWMAKHKLNMTWFDMSTYRNFSGSAFQKTFPEVGPPVEKPLFQYNMFGNKVTPPLFEPGYCMGWAWPNEYRDKLTREAFSYGRDLGIRIAYSFVEGDVTPAFQKIHPEIKYLGGPPEQYWQLYQVDLLDPHFKEITSRYIRTVINMFGTDHIYDCTPFVESAAPVDDKIQAALRVFNILREIDPGCTCRMSSYGLMVGMDSNDAKKYVKAMPHENFVFIDQKSVEDKYYEKYDSFYGHTWLAGLLHNYVPWDEMHGNVPNLLSVPKELVAKRDTSARNCRGFTTMSEANGHNVMFFDLYTRMAWDPAQVDFTEFLKDYCDRRYGGESAENMVKCYQEIISVLYKDNNLNENMYQRILGLADPIRILAYNENPIGFNFRVLTDEEIKLLKRSIHYAWLEKDKQKDNLLYEKFMVELVHNYLIHEFNRSCVKAAVAFKNKDVNEFGIEALQLNSILQKIENLLSTQPDLSMLNMIQEVMKVPGTNRFAPLMIRVAHFNEGYASVACYETVHYLYKPVWAEYLKMAGCRLKKSEQMVLSDWAPQMNMMLKDFMTAEDLEVPFKYKGSYLDAISAACAGIENWN